MPPAGRDVPWECVDVSAPFAELTVEAQRDELLAAVGLLVEALAGLPSSMPILPPMMTAVLREMGERYGPWVR